MADYDFSEWNKHRKSYNCYEFALSDLSNGDDGKQSVPGYAGGSIDGALTPESWKEALKADGITFASDSIVHPSKDGHYIIAFACTEIDIEKAQTDSKYLRQAANGFRWHFYRQMPDGSWWHKMGEGEVSNKDISGNAIVDPTSADKKFQHAEGGYTHLSYYYVPDGGLKTSAIRPTEVNVKCEPHSLVINAGKSTYQINIDGENQGCVGVSQGASDSTPLLMNASDIGFYSQIMTSARAIYQSGVSHGGDAPQQDIRHLINNIRQHMHPIR